MLAPVNVPLDGQSVGSLISISIKWVGDLQLDKHSMVYRHYLIGLVWITARRTHFEETLRLLLSLSKHQWNPLAGKLLYWGREGDNKRVFDVCSEKPAAFFNMVIMQNARRFKVRTCLVVQQDLLPWRWSIQWTRSGTREFRWWWRLLFDRFWLEC